MRFSLPKPVCNLGRRTFLTLSIFIMVCLYGKTALAQANVINSVREAFRIGSSKELVKCLGPSVEVKMDGARADYNRTQAEVVFRDFFKKCPPSKYELSHQGSSPDGSRYIIDKYYCAEGSYVVWILVKDTKGESMVSKVSILKE